MEKYQNEEIPGSGSMRRDRIVKRGGICGGRGRGQSLVPRFLRCLWILEQQKRGGHPGAAFRSIGKCQAAMVGKAKQAAGIESKSLVPVIPGFGKKGIAAFFQSGCGKSRTVVGNLRQQGAMLQGEP